MRCYESRHTLAVLRKIIGLSQSELATLAGCSKRTIQAIEIGRLKLSENLAARIAHETGVTQGWLLGGDYHAPPRMALTDVPYNKKIYEDTRAAITTGQNPNPITINLAQEFGGALNVPPFPRMAQEFGQLSTLLHPNVDYWLASILSSIFAASKSGQGSLAIGKLLKFSDAMVKDFGQRFDGEFTNDAVVVFEQALQRIKMAELVQKSKHDGSTPTPKPSAEKRGSTHTDLLADSLLAAESKGFDMEALWMNLNNVGERIKARNAAAQKVYDTYMSELMAVYRAEEPGDRQSSPPNASSKPPRNE